MKKILTLLIITIAISACKKDTPKKTAVQELPGKKFKVRGGFYLGLRFITTYTILEFKTNNEYLYTLTEGEDYILKNKIPMKWEPKRKEPNKINLWYYNEPLDGELKGDTLITSYNNDGFVHYVRIKD